MQTQLAQGHLTADEVLSLDNALCSVGEERELDISKTAFAILKGCRHRVCGQIRDRLFRQACEVGHADTGDKRVNHFDFLLFG